MVLPEDAPIAERLKLMGLKKEVMASVLSAGVRVNDAALRKQDKDKVGELLAKVKGKTSPEPEPEVSEKVTMSDLFN